MESILIRETGNLCMDEHDCCYIDSAFVYNERTASFSGWKVNLLLDFLDCAKVDHIKASHALVEIPHLHAAFIFFIVEFKLPFTYRGYSIVGKSSKTVD